jgi:hypothetical protein
MYQAFQRGDSVERAHAAVMAIVDAPATQQAAPVAPAYWNSQRKMIERAIIGLRDGWATRKDAEDALAALASAPVTQQAGAAVEPKCKTCGGMGVVDDGEIDCYQNGEPYENGPVKCVKDCPDCTPAATTASLSGKLADLEARQRVAVALGLGRSIKASFAWEYLLGVIEEMAEADDSAQAPSRDASLLSPLADRAEKAAILGSENQCRDLLLEIAQQGASHAANAGEDTERNVKP